MSQNLHLKISKPTEKLLENEKRNKRKSKVFTKVKFIFLNKIIKFLI